MKFGNYILTVAVTLGGSLVFLTLADQADFSIRSWAIVLLLTLVGAVLKHAGR